MRRTTTCSLVLAVLLLLLPASGAGAQAGNDPACFIAKSNESRAARGYPALAADPALGSLATLHAQEMARDLKAAPIDNEELKARAPAGALLLGQNVGTGTTCEELHATFLSYPQDQNRILDPHFDRIGVGVATVGEVMYVSEILMQSGTAQPAPAPNRTAASSPTPRSTVPATPSHAPSASPSATDVSPTPTAAPSESAPAPILSLSPTPSASAAALGTSKPNRRVPLMVGFALAIVATAALGALVQTRRPKR
jgi:cysteine-rich secretory family protein